jgi:beta-glucosidase
VLLKNEAGLLPLDRDKIKSIAVIGPNADVLEFGNYTGTPTKAVNVLEGVKSKVGSNIEVGFAKGCEIAYLPTVPSEYLVCAGDEKGQPGLKGEYFSNRDLSGEPVLVRIDETIDFNWGEGSPDKQIDPNGFSVRWTGKLIAPVSGGCKLNLTAHRGNRLYIDGKLLIDRWGGWRLETDVAALKLNKGREYDIKVEYAGGSRTRGRQSSVRLGWDVVKDEKITKGIEAAVELAKKSDVAVAVLGINQEIEGESHDRFDMDLPGNQNDLVREIYKANPKTVVVLLNGSPLSIGWLKENIPAVVEAWYPGEEGGTAVADVLFGDYNPAGRLSMTFYKSVEQLPPFDDYDIRKGRTYMHLKERPLFPFGYGLSYTTFEYGGLSVEPKKIGSSGKVNVSINVKNTGQYDGDEVVQLYVRDVEASLQRPMKQLAGFERIHLKKGEEKTVGFTLTAESFSYYDVAGGKFIVEPGRFDVMIGASSDDIRAKDSFEVVTP